MSAGLVRFSAWKVARGYGPTVVAGLVLFALLVGPVLYAWRQGMLTRVSIAGPLALAAVGGYLLLIAAQAVIAFRYRGYGVLRRGDRLVVFTWIYRTIPVNQIRAVEVVNVQLMDRVAVVTRDGRRHVILTNLMAGTAAGIADKLKAALALT